MEVALQVVVETEDCDQRPTVVFSQVLDDSIINQTQDATKSIATVAPNSETVVTQSTFDTGDNQFANLYPETIDGPSPTADEAEDGDRQQTSDFNFDHFFNEFINQGHRVPLGGGEFFDDSDYDKIYAQEKKLQETFHGSIAYLRSLITYGRDLENAIKTVQNGTPLDFEDSDADVVLTLSNRVSNSITVNATSPEDELAASRYNKQLDMSTTLPNMLSVAIDGTAPERNQEDRRTSDKLDAQPIKSSGGSVDRFGLNSEHRCLVELGSGDYFGDEDLLQISNQMKKMKTTRDGRVRFLRALKKFRRDLDRLDYASTGVKNNSTELIQDDTSDGEPNEEHDCARAIVNEIMTKVGGKSQNGSNSESSEKETQSTEEPTTNIDETAMAVEMPAPTGVTCSTMANTEPSLEGHEAMAASLAVSKALVDSLNKQLQEMTKSASTSAPNVDPPERSHEEPLRKSPRLHKDAARTVRKQLIEISTDEDSDVTSDDESVDTSRVAGSHASTSRHGMPGDNGNFVSVACAHCSTILSPRNQEPRQTPIQNRSKTSRASPKARKTVPKTKRVKPKPSKARFQPEPSKSNRKTQLIISGDFCTMKGNKFQCSKCDSVFSEKRSCKAHFIAKHVMKQTMVKCPVAGCNRKFSTEKYLNAHLKNTKTLH